MTTIVADRRRGCMAADRRVTSNDGEVIMTCPTKIERVLVGGKGGDPYLLGLAGLEGPGQVFLDWFKNGSWEEPPEPLYNLEADDAFSVLVLGLEGMWVVDKFMRMTPLYDRFYGIGSGGCFAWAILMAGCGMKKAMETAIDMDPYSGGGYDIEFLVES